MPLSVITREALRFGLLLWALTPDTVRGETWSFDGRLLVSDQGNLLRPLRPPQGEAAPQLSARGEGDDKALLIRTIPARDRSPDARSHVGFINDVDYRDFCVSIDLESYPFAPPKTEIYVLWARMSEQLDGYILWLVNKHDLDPDDPSETGRATFGLQQLVKGRSLSQGNASPAAGFNLRVPGWSDEKRYRMIFQGWRDQLFGTLQEIDGAGRPRGDPVLRQTFRIYDLEAGPRSGKTGFTLLGGRKIGVDNYAAARLEEPPAVFPEITVDGTIGRVDVKDRMQIAVSLAVNRPELLRNGVRARLSIFMHDRWPTGHVPNGQPVTNFYLADRERGEASSVSGASPVPVYEGPLRRIPRVTLPASPIRVDPEGDYLIAFQVALDENGDGRFSTPWTSVVQAMAMD